jgi:hypothetical protein
MLVRMSSILLDGKPFVPVCWLLALTPKMVTVPCSESSMNFNQYIQRQILVDSTVHEIADVISNITLRCTTESVVEKLDSLCKILWNINRSGVVIFHDH